MFNKIRFGVIAILLAILFEDQIFRGLVRLWVLPSDHLPAKVEVIAPLSYGAYKDKLLIAQEKFMEETCLLWDLHNEAVIVSGAFTHSPDPKFEEQEKRRIVGDRTFVFAGNVASTITEAETIRRVILKRYNHEPQTIVVVTGELHGRSARFVWQKTFPQSQIVMRFIPWQYEIEPKNTMVLARNKWTWLSAHVGRQALIAWIPFDIGYNAYKKLGIRQPTF